MIRITRRLPNLLYTYKYTLYSIVILLSIIIYFLFRWNLFCINLQAWQHVSKMCKLYEDGYAIGTLCPPLCTNIHSIKCHTFKSTTKQIIFSGEFNNDDNNKQRVVFKSSSVLPTLEQKLHWYDNGVIKYPTDEEFLLTIKTMVKRRLNLTLTHDTIKKLSRLLPLNNNGVEGVQRYKEMNNLWVLLQDNEYLLSKIYDDKDVFPQLYGSCGQYYGVEYIQPLTDILMDSSDIITRDDWGKHLRIAIQILDLVDVLENDFNEPLYLCDIKLQHFGHTVNQGKLKLLDLNNIYPKSIINTIIKNIDYCQVDEDCDFYDCRSKCLKHVQKCQPTVLNSNLQIICEKIFLGWRLSNRIIIPGLLMTQFTSAELASILRQCSNPDNDNGRVPRSRTDDEIKRRLINILSEMEQVINNDFFR